MKKMNAEQNGYFKGIRIDMETADDLYQNLWNFMKKEKLALNLSKGSDGEFWLDGPEKKITVKILLDVPSRKILYDVYSVIDAMHLREKTLKQNEENEYIQEEHRRWKTAEVLEEVWLVIDAMILWSQKNNYSINETKLI
jgi:hypothetical protein